MANGQIPCWSRILNVMARGMPPYFPLPTAQLQTVFFYRLDETLISVCFVLNLYMHVGYTLVVRTMNELRQE